MSQDPARAVGLALCGSLRFARLHHPGDECWRVTTRTASGTRWRCEREPSLLSAGNEAESRLGSSTSNRTLSLSQSNSTTTSRSAEHSLPPALSCQRSSALSRVARQHDARRDQFGLHVHVCACADAVSPLCPDR